MGDKDNRVKGVTAGARMGPDGKYRPVFLRNISRRQVLPGSGVSMTPNGPLYVDPDVEGSAEFRKLPDLKRRSEMARVESLAQKLWQAVAERKPGEMEMILRMMQAEGWKRGVTISYEDVKLLAIAQMKRAAATMKAQEDRKF